MNQKRICRAAWLALAMGLAGACGNSSQTAAPAESSASAPIPEPGQLAESSKAVIAVLGDSLTAGLGLTLAEAFPSRLQEMFASEGYGEVEVINAGVSGDTTAGGLRRAESVISPNVKILVVALGGNDALRGLGVTQTRDNLSAIVDGALNAGVRVLLVGMEGPTNLGDDYRLAFRNVFAQIAQNYRGRISYIPFLLEGVAGNAALNQADGIHPTAEGQRIVAAHLYPTLRDMVDQLPTPVR